MEAVTAFVDAFYGDYVRSGYAREEDQHLPSKDVLVRVCGVLLNTSCFREEGRYSSFRVCFISPDSELLDSYLYSHTVLFENPISFQPRELHRLAPALNADMVSKFTMVDGAVVLTKDFELLGFGAETLVGKEIHQIPDMCFIGYDGKEDKTKHFSDNGMRHRSCYHFCDMVEGTVGIIFSHDDVIKACTKHNGRVIVYDHVVLPLL